jgi:uncharacterized protein (TIGR00297 family)
MPNNISLFNFLIGFLASVLLAVASFRFNALTLSGGIGMVIIGTVVFGAGGLPLAIPLVFFFVSSSYLSRLKNSRKTEALKLAGKIGPRDIWQVLANGFMAALSVVIYVYTGEPVWLAVYLACIAEATADTWATEFGTLSKSPPVLILTFKKVPAGQAGGISILGTVPAGVGAVMITAVGFITMNIMPGESTFNWSSFIVIAVAGFLGSVIDSVLGASIQSQYECTVCGKMVERNFHCDRKSNLVRGFRIINNDMVNFLSTLSAGLLAYLIISVI